MKRFKKVLFIFFLVLLVILVGGIVALRIAFPPAKVKSILVSKISQALNREVQISGISLTLGGLKVKGFNLSERPTFAQGTFIEVKEFIVKPRILLLLKKQISIGEVKLVSPRLSIIRRKDGSFNFSDLMVKELPQRKAEKEAKKVVEEKEKAIPLSLLVSRFSVSNGNVKFIDETPQNLTLELRNLDLGVYGISLTTPFFLEISSEILKDKLEASLSFKGSIDLKEEKVKIKEAVVTLGGASLVAAGQVEKFSQPDKLSFALDIRSKDFTLEKLSRVVPYTGNIMLAGGPEINVKISGNLKRIEVKGKLDLKKVDIMVKDIFRKAPDLDARVEADLLIEETNALNVRSLNCLLGGINASCQGRIAGFKGGDLTLNLKLSLGRFDIKSFAELVPLLKAYGISGNIGGEVEASGKLQSLYLDGNIQAENTGIAQRDMTVKLDRSTLQYQGRLVSLKKPSVHFGLNMGVLEIKMPEKKEVKEEERESGKQGKSLAQKKSIPVALPPDVTVSGELRLNKATFQNFQVSDCFARISLGKQVLTIDPLSLKAYDGTVKSSFTIDLSSGELDQVKFELASDIRNIDIHKIIMSFKKDLVAQVYAGASGSIRMTGKGIDFSSFGGSGSMEIRDVKISGIKILDRIAQAANISELKETSFKSATGEIRIRKGKVSLANLKTEGGDKLDAYCTGDIDLVRKEQDLKGDLKFAKQYSGGALAKYAGDAEGRVTVPFKIGGNFADPQVNINWEKLTKKAAEKAAEDILKKELEKSLKKLFQK